MMSGYEANPTFFNKKNKDQTSRTLPSPQPPTSDNISFLPPPATHLQNGRHMSITLNKLARNPSRQLHVQS